MADPTPIRLDWRLTATPTGWRVLDISVEGVSLLLTFRNEFAAVIERSGGQLAGLIDELRQPRGRRAGTAGGLIDRVIERRQPLFH